MCLVERVVQGVEFIPRISLSRESRNGARAILRNPPIENQMPRVKVRQDVGNPPRVIGGAQLKTGVSVGACQDGRETIVRLRCKFFGSLRRHAPMLRAAARAGAANDYP